MRFERSGRGQEPSRGHKFSILENFLSIRDFTSAMRPHFRSDLVGACLPQTLLRTDEEELCQFDAIPPTYREKQSVPDGERPIVHIAIVCGLWQGASYSGAHPVFVSSRLGVRQNAFTGSFSPWLHRGWFCAVPPSGRTIPPLQGRREQRRHWFWYPVRRSFPCPQRTA